MQDALTAIDRLKKRHLTAILAVARSGSVRRAAEQMALSQSAISKTLMEAEELVGVQLFKRTAYGSAPTPVGEVLVRLSERVTAEIRLAAMEFDRLMRGESGTLTIGVLPQLASWETLVRCIDEFRQASPGVRLTLRQGRMEELLKATESGAVNLVIGRLPRDATPKTIHSEALVDGGNPVFVGRSGHPLLDAPVTVERLVEFPWFMPEPPHDVFSAVVDLLQSTAVNFPSRVVYSHVDAISLALCARSDMLAIVPSLVLQEVGAIYGLRALDFPVPLQNAPVCVMWHPERPLEPAVRAFVERLKRATHSTLPFKGIR